MFLLISFLKQKRYSSLTTLIYFSLLFFHSLFPPVISGFLYSTLPSGWCSELGNHCIWALGASHIFWWWSLSGGWLLTIIWCSLHLKLAPDREFLWKQVFGFTKNRRVWLCTAKCIFSRHHVINIYCWGWEWLGWLCLAGYWKFGS